MTWLLNAIGLSKIEMILLACFAGIVIAGGAVTWIYHEGKDSGVSTVKTAVQDETIKRTEKARIEKENADAEIRNLPYTERVDSLR